MSTTTYHHRPPTKIHPPIPTISQKWTTTPQKPKYIHVDIALSFFFFQMQYSFPWRRFCGIKFWSVRFSKSKFLLHSVYFTIFKISCNFIKKETLVQVLSCEFCEIFLRTPFATEHLRWLLLNISFSITIWKNCVKVKKTLN